MFNPEADLSTAERAHLVQVSLMPGYKALHKVMRAEVDKFILALINTDAADDNSVLAAHKMSKAAAQFFASVTKRVNEELAQFQNAERPGDVAADVTEQLIDLGERSTDEFGMPLPNILEEMNGRES